MKLSEEFRREMTLCHEAAIPVWERAAEMAERYEDRLRDALEKIADNKYRADTMYGEWLSDIAEEALKT